VIFEGGRVSVIDAHEGSSRNCRLVAERARVRNRSGNAGAFHHGIRTLPTSETFMIVQVLPERGGLMRGEIGG